MRKSVEVERRGQAPGTAGDHRDVVAYDTRRWGKRTSTRAENECVSQVHLGIRIGVVLSITALLVK